jgi:hypothetical protein
MLHILCILQIAVFLIVLPHHSSAIGDWFSSAGDSSPRSRQKQVDQTLIPGEKLIQCSSKAIKAYNTVPPASEGHGDLQWCRATMKRAKTIMYVSEQFGVIDLSLMTSIFFSSCL